MRSSPVPWERYAIHRLDVRHRQLVKLIPVYGQTAGAAAAAAASFAATYALGKAASSSWPAGGKA